MGFRKGDVVSFQLPNWREVAPLDIAAAYLGLVLCPIIPIYRAKEVQFILQASQSKLHLTADVYRSHDFRAMLEKLAPELPDLRHVVYVRPTHECPYDFRALIESGKGHT